MKTEVPITNHPSVPDGVPLVASFHDDRNRLSYYYPILREIDHIRTPITKFFPIEGSVDSFPTFDARVVTEYMQEQQMQKAFARGDYSSAKFDDSGRVLESQDPYHVDECVYNMVRELSIAERHIGGRFAVREWIPHDVEVRYFIRDGEIIYHDSVMDLDGFPPTMQAQLVAESFDSLAWSCDFIRHRETDSWYCIDMGLDGLYYNEAHGWTAISEHLDKSHSPQQYADDMPNPEVLSR